MFHSDFSSYCMSLGALSPVLKGTVMVPRQVAFSHSVSWWGSHSLQDVSLSFAVFKEEEL